MFWSGERIHKFFMAERIVEPFDPGRVDCNAYELSIGSRFFVTQEFSKVPSGSRIQDFKIDNKFIFPESREIPPGHFAFLMTREIVRIPHNAMGFISLKTKKAKFRGLVNISGFHVDPGYEGYLVFAVFNAGPTPILVEQHETFFVLWLADISSSDERPENSKFLKDTKLGDTVLNAKLVENISGPLYSLQDLAVKYSNLDREIGELRAVFNLAKFIVPVLLTIFGIAISSIILWLRLNHGE